MVPLRPSTSDRRKDPKGRSTDEDSLAFAAAFRASLESNLASFHALIRIGRFELDLALLVWSTESGSTVDGTLPGSRCGTISSCRRWELDDDNDEGYFCSFSFYLVIDEDSGGSAPGAPVLKANGASAAHAGGDGAHGRGWQARLLVSRRGRRSRRLALCPHGYHVLIRSDALIIPALFSEREGKYKYIHKCI